MSKKIVITGGLGYIGTELCKIYSGVSWNNEILVIDNRFVSERVSQLRNWGIDFVHGDILDKDLVNRYCKDANIVHHLAGITDVPRLKSESSDDKDAKIKLVAEEGTQNILDVISDKCKIIFPSSHVVYEGIEKVKNDMLEDEHTKPILSYAKSKTINEKQLKNSGKNYIILRLGSVYGYSTDTARIDIMPNHFSKIASQNGTFGLTTLRRKHMHLEEDQIVFEYKGKSNKIRHVEIDDAILTKLIKKSSELPGYEIFRYKDQSGCFHAVDSDEVNSYIHLHMGEAFSSKDFRTWVATRLAVELYPYALEAIASSTKKKFSNTLIRMVADELGNTPTVCKSYYVHPSILQKIEARTLPNQFYEDSGALSWKLTASEKQLLKHI